MQQFAEEKWNIMKKKEYKRNAENVGRYILKVLQTLGGSASRQSIKEGIVDDEGIGISYEDVFEPITSRNGTQYIPFNMDFNFSLVNLLNCGYIQAYDRGGDIVLTEKGRSADMSLYPTEDDMRIQNEYWDKKHKERYLRRKEKSKVDKVENEDPQFEDTEDESDMTENWKIDVLNQIKLFSPKKFESFSRLLFSHMGIKFDREKGVKMSGDHGIDGYGYFESDEFRTAKVVVQCKRYTDNPVSEPEIDKFKGVMMSFNADYGIFITTSYFTKQAQSKAVQGGNTVTLIDGQRLVELIEKYELHITPVQTYVLDDYYFQKD